MKQLALVTDEGPPTDVPLCPFKTTKTQPQPQPPHTHKQTMQSTTYTYGVVDRPTQLICIWILYLRKHTNTEDIAGQSATPRLAFIKKMLRYMCNS